MAAYYEKLSPNQEEALLKPCRKCGRGPHYTTTPNDGGVWEVLSNNIKLYKSPHNDGVRKRVGRYGPWVQCMNCGDKVYRPRGRNWKTYNTNPLERPIQQEVPTTPTQPTVSLTDIEHAVAKLIGPEANAALRTLVEEKIKAIAERAKADTDSIKAAAQKALEAERKVIQDELLKLQASRPVVIELRRDDKPIAVIKDEHYLMPRLLNLLSAGFHLYLWGPAGSGKTTAALHAAEHLGRKAELDTLDPTTFRSMVQGYMTPQGDPVHTTFTRCWIEGKVYVADEADNAPGHVQTLFNSALANHHAPLAWGNVGKSDTFGFVGTGNTPGRPTREFPDRKPMSAAFADRLYFIHWPLDPAIECRAAGLPIPPRTGEKAETCKPGDWVTFVRLLRDWATKECPTLMITPRASLLGIKALELGETPSNIADALIFRGADSEIRTKALAAVRW